MTQIVLRRYSVTVQGWDIEQFNATSSGKARYQAFKAFREIGWKGTFLKFLTISSILALGTASQPDDNSANL